MSSILLIYKSKTGFTKKYVDWICEQISCKTISYDEVNNIDINDYKIIVYGAGMHAGHIKRLKWFKKNFFEMQDKDIIIFSTGGAPYSEEIFSNIKKNNFTDNELTKIKFFYFQSGINYEKMGFLDKTIMKSYNKVLELKSNKSNLEEGTIKAISKSYDKSNKDFIEPFINYLNQKNSI